MLTINIARFPILNRPVPLICPASDLASLSIHLKIVRGLNLSADSSQATVNFIAQTFTLVALIVRNCFIITVSYFIRHFSQSMERLLSCVNIDKVLQIIQRVLILSAVCIIMHYRW